MKTVDYTFFDESHYVGSWDNGAPAGEGVITYKNGDRYEGSWNGWQREGYGVFTSADGERYEGYWLNDQKHGYGIEINKKGDRYEGNWEKNLKHGEGKLVCADGDRFEGTWRFGNQLTGYRIMHYFDDSWYEGMIVDMCETPDGTMHYPDGSSYTGQWDRHGSHGEGVFVFSDGVRYEGKFRSGDFHGKCKMIFPDGTVEDAEFSDGIPISGGDRTLERFGVKRDFIIVDGEPYLYISIAHSFFGGESFSAYHCPLRVGEFPYNKLRAVSGGASEGSFKITEVSEDRVFFVVAKKFSESGEDELHSVSTSGESVSFKRSEDYTVTIEDDPYDCTSTYIFTVGVVKGE